MLSELFATWVTAPGWDYFMVAYSCVVAFTMILLLTRVFGLRTFAKMSSFDFATTVAMGSILASTVLTRKPPLMQAGVALVTLYLLVHLCAWGRTRWAAFSRLLDNDPVLLMDGPRILHQNLEKTRVSENELVAKLREANVLHLGQVRAVVMESTGDISVLHGEESGPSLDPYLLKGVEEKKE